jgi:hypothetical protein
MSSWWWVESPLETCRAVCKYKWTVYCCILLDNYWIKPHFGLNYKHFCRVRWSQRRIGPFDLSSQPCYSLNFSSTNSEGLKMFRRILPLLLPDCNKFLHSIAPMWRGVEWLPLYAEYLQADEVEGNVFPVLKHRDTMASGCVGNLPRIPEPCTRRSDCSCWPSDHL